MSVKMLLFIILAVSNVHAEYNSDDATNYRQLVLPYKPPPSSKYQIKLPLQQQKLQVKWNHFGRIRRFTINNENCCIFDELMRTIQMYEPAFAGTLAWKDDEGDLVLLNSPNELNLAVKQNEDGLLRLITVDDKLSNSQTMKTPMLHHIMQPQSTTRGLAHSKEANIEPEAEPLSQGTRSGLPMLYPVQRIRPVLIIRDCKHELELTNATKSETHVEQTVQPTTTTVTPEITSLDSTTV